ncbi:MAG: hypothetical protein ABSF95_15360 [Verrucomicrobiota bacterium]|jgi:hypothetical protein
MHTSSAPEPASYVAEINESARRATGATSEFFHACSLQRSRSDCAELRFLRSVLFYHSLLSECGAKPVRFCVNQSQFKPLLAIDAVAALQIIYALRTQAAHSLEQGSNGGQLQSAARSWFRQHTRSDFPPDENHWRTCVQAVEQMGCSILEAIKRFLQTIETDPEMDAMRNELRQTIEGGLSRMDIEAVAAQVLAEQAREDLSPGKFSDRYFFEWYSTLKLKSERTDLLLDARKLIETTLSQIPEPPPVTAKQIMDTLGVPQGPMVGELVRERDRLFKAGTRNPQELLDKLAVFHTALTSPAPNRPAS